MRKASLASLIVGIVFGVIAVALIVLGIVALCPVTRVYQYMGTYVRQSSTSPLWQYSNTFFLMGGFTLIASVLLFILSAVIQVDEDVILNCSCMDDCYDIEDDPCAFCGDGEKCCGDCNCETENEQN